MQRPTKPLPRITSDNSPFFDGTRTGVLRIQQCDECGMHVFPVRLACPNCLSTSGLHWVEVSGRGDVYSFCVVHRPHDPAFYGEVPIVFAAIRLEEGPTILSEVHGVPPEQVRIGLPVHVQMARLTDEISVPVWTAV